MIESPHNAPCANPSEGPEIVRDFGLQKSRPELRLRAMERRARTLLATAFLLLPLTAGCGQKDPGVQKVETAVDIAKEIAAAPDSAEAVLKKHGMTNKEYQALVFEITGDEKLNKLYLDGLGR